MTRRREYRSAVRIAVALCVGVPAVVGCTGRPTGGPGTPGIQAVPLTPTPTLHPRARTELPIGVQVFEADVTTDALDRLRSAGVAWARTRALWKLIEQVERTPPAYDWSVTDWLFGDTAAAGFRNVASVYANPPWAAERECGPVRAAKMDRYAALWTALVERYDGDGEDDAPNGAVVRYWQVSNEADFDPTAVSDESDYGGCFGDDPAAYAEHVVVAWRAARAADPDVHLSFGPVAYDRFTAASAPAGWAAPPGPFVYDFPQRAIEHLYRTYPDDPALPFFDFVSLHNYNDNSHFWDAASPGGEREMIAKIARFRDEQLTVPSVFDLRSLPLIISETGFASSPSDEYTERDEELQAVYAVQTMVRAQAAGVIAAIWYTARDNIFGDCVPPHWDWLTFGLMRSSEYQQELGARCPIHPWIDDYRLDEGPATPRPALYALETLIRTLAGSSFDRRLDLDETGDPAIEAYRFRDPVGRSTLVAWTTTGERLGKRGVTPVSASLDVTSALISPWTDAGVTVSNLAGAFRTLGGAGAITVTVPVEQAPVYITAGDGP